MASLKSLPLFVLGKVVKGFGRGSKELGIPTANMSETTIDLLPENLRPGVYYGFASVDCGPVHKMVLSVGWNPFYHNEKKSMETYILHTFEKDFYGSLIRVAILDYIRPERNFSSQDELIAAINGDVATARSKLEDQAYQHFYKHGFWTKACSNESEVHTQETFLPKSGSASQLKDVIMNGNSDIVH